MDTANALESVSAEGTLLTALTRDGGARLLFAHTTKIVEYARLRHDCSRTVTAALDRSFATSDRWSCWPSEDYKGNLATSLE